MTACFILALNSFSFGASRLASNVASRRLSSSRIRGATSERIVTAALSAAFGRRLCFRDRSLMMSWAFIREILGAGFESRARSSPCAGIARTAFESVMFRDCREGRGVSICDQKVGSKPNRSPTALGADSGLRLAILRRLRPISAHPGRSGASLWISEADMPGSRRHATAWIAAFVRSAAGLQVRGACL